MRQVTTPRFETSLSTRSMRFIARLASASMGDAEEEPSDESETAAAGPWADPPPAMLPPCAPGRDEQGEISSRCSVRVWSS